MSDDRKNLTMIYNCCPKGSDRPTMSARIGEGDVSMEDTYALESSFLDAWEARLDAQIARHEARIKAGASEQRKRQVDATSDRRC